MEAGARRSTRNAGRWARYTDRVRATWHSLVRPPEPAAGGPRFGPALAWRRVRERLLPNIPFIVRLTAASVVAYLVVEQVYPGSGDLTGALTALLVVRASLVETFSSGLDRIVSVMTGVLIAAFVAGVTGLTWWSLALVISSALALAWIFDLGDNRLETAISAMLILGASSPDTSAAARMGMTVIGALVGFASTVLFPPPVLSAAVSDSVVGVSDQTATATRLIAGEMREGMTPARFDLWIRSLHRVLPEVAAADVKIRESENRRRYNPRAIRGDAAIPVLRAGLSSLDRVVLAMRHALMSLQSSFPVGAGASAGADEDDRRADPAVAGVFGVVFEGIANAIGGYGPYVRAVADGDEEGARAARRAMSQDVAETRAMLADLSLAAPAGDSAWMLQPAVLSSLDAVLAELSPDRQHKRLVGWQARQSADAVFRAPIQRERRRRRGRAANGSTAEGAQAASGLDEKAAPPTLAITYRDGLSSPGLPEKRTSRAPEDPGGGTGR